MLFTRSSRPGCAAAELVLGEFAGRVSAHGMKYKHRLPRLTVKTSALCCTLPHPVVLKSPHSFTRTLCLHSSFRL